MANDYKKTDLIREMLLKTVGKNRDLFCYYVAIQEAKELIGKSTPEEINKMDFNKPYKKLCDG